MSRLSVLRRILRVSVVCFGLIDYNYRERVYDQNDFKVIFVHLFKESEKWRKFLVDRIKFFQEQRDYKVQYMLDSYTSQLEH